MNIKEHTPHSENNSLTATTYSLQEYIERRNNGKFWTPTPFVDYAHKMISEQLGDDWREKFVVWDNCCGAKNLTRNYNFKELYCSTLFESELKIGERYNKEAVSFQYDFLNDNLDKLPKGLLDAFEQNKPIVFLLNPPYVAANNSGKDGSSKRDVAKTAINNEMVSNNIGRASQNLYAQFLYRITKIKRQYGLTNCYIAIYCPMIFLTGVSWKNFRKIFLDEFAFNSGVLFCASYFTGVSDSFGISFSIWEHGTTENKHDFPYNLIDLAGGEIKIVGKKVVYNTDEEKTAREWAKDPIRGIKALDAPQMANGLVCKRDGKGNIVPNALGYYVNVANNVYKNQTDVYFVSSCSSMSHGFSIMPQNFERVCANFASRRLVFGNWINVTDEYLVPDTTSDKWNEFVLDSVIYSTFHSASSQSSLRNIEYKGKLWDIKNEFFWMPKQDIMDLANEYNMDKIYGDARTSDERYVYKYIRERKEEFSQEALNVLNKAIELTKKSFKYRRLFADEHPEYQVDKVWDCGFYQLRGIWKKYMKDEFETFKEAYKELSDKMLPIVYELGFLK